MSDWNVFMGIVVQDKVHNSRLVKVYLKDLLPFLDGEVSDNDGLESMTYIDDLSGEEVVEEVATTNHITAEWFSMDTNRVFPPDVRRGEQVMVIKYSDEDLYYWMSSGRDDRLRRLELHRIAVSNDSSVDKELDDTNTYFIEMDTLFTKRIRIVTSQSDGEDYKYEVVIDAKNNFMSMSDDTGNEVILESDIPRVKMKNNKGTLLDLNNDDAIIIAPRDIVIKANRQVVIKATNITNDASEAIKCKAQNIGTESNHLDLDASTVGISGTLKVMTNILTMLVTATSYNNGSPGSPYPSVNTTVSSGTGTTVAPPLPDASGTGGRHCSAKEQVLSMAELIKSMFDRIHGHEGIDLSGRENIPVLASASLMSNNKGD